MVISTSWPSRHTTGEDCTKNAPVDFGDSVNSEGSVLDQSALRSMKNLDELAVEVSLRAMLIE
jgi:hypothetical protein